MGTCRQYRTDAYTEVDESFVFLHELKTLDTEKIKESAIKLVLKYPNDLNDELEFELFQIKSLVSTWPGFKPFKFIRENDNLHTTFPNVEIALIIFPRRYPVYYSLRSQHVENFNDIKQACNDTMVTKKVPKCNKNPR